MFAAAPKNRGSAKLRKMIFLDDGPGVGDPTPARTSESTVTRRILDMPGNEWSWNVSRAYKPPTFIERKTFLLEA